MYVCMYVCVCVYVCIHVCICSYMYVCSRSVWMCTLYICIYVCKCMCVYARVYAVRRGVAEVLRGPLALRKATEVHWEGDG